MPATTSISLKINGAAEALPVDTVSALLDAKGVDPARKGIAVAVNGSVVPRTRWAAHPLAAGDAVEIIQAKQGG